jgi:beta-glucosidase
MNATSPYRDPSLPIEQRLDDLLEHMTLEEKIAQMSIFQMRTNNLPDEKIELDETVRARLANGVGALGRPGLYSSPRATALWTNAIQHYLREHTRLGIPAFFIDEALHGLMAQGSTSFPQAIALASTWNPALVEEVFAAAAREMRARGGNWALTPVLDLAREPRWGRTEETYGEDPYLCSRMGVAAIRGLQGVSLADGSQPIDRQHVLATAKHFAAHGQPEGGRNAAPANYAEREIRESFLAAFQSAVKEAGVGAVMASYNEINGIPVHANRWLLEQVLRQEWGFQGLLTSDGNGISQLESVHHIAASQAEAARKALAAGIDFELDSCFHTLIEQVQQGQVPLAWIDRAVRRILRAKFLLGLFENPYVDPDVAEQITNCADHRRLAYRAAAQSLILLKNDGLLPLDITRLRTLAVIGPNAAGLHLGGYSANPGHGLSILDGLRQKAQGRIQILYAEGCKITQEDFDGQGWRGWHEDAATLPTADQDEQRIAEAVAIARQAEVALLVLGENESVCREAWSEKHLGDRDTLDLPGRQNELARAVIETGVPTVVLLLNGRPLTVNDLAKRANALFEGWYLGQEGGAAFADVLFGDISPGGKLPITFPRAVGQLPAYYNHKPSRQRSYLFSDSTPLFPFGYGLSYTTFRYANLRLTPAKIGPNDSTTVSVEVTNTGQRTGDEVVQLYVHDVLSEMVTRPVKELKGFRRITLQPGETQTVRFTLTAAELSFLNENMERVVEPGMFEITVGGDSVRGLTALLEVAVDSPAED